MICLKGNQETLHEDVKLYFETALAEPKLYDFVKSKPKTEKGHGRIETRQYFLSTEISDFISAEEWKGIAAIGMVRSKRIINEEESVENRYFITSLTDLQKFSNAVRKHWGIENELHWCLDMNFDEDRCRTRVDNSGENRGFWHKCGWGSTFCTHIRAVLRFRTGGKNQPPRKRLAVTSRIR